MDVVAGVVIAVLRGDTSLSTADGGRTCLIVRAVPGSPPRPSGPTSPQGGGRVRGQVIM